MSITVSSRRALALAGCAALSLSVAACSSSGSASAGGGSSAHTTAAAAATSADPDAGLPTGTQLKADLLTTMPTGYALDTSGSVDSGSDYQAPSATSPANGCASLEGTSWINIAGQGSVSFAENDYVDKDTSEELAQEVDAFQGTTAQAVMTALAGITAKCATFTDSQTSSTVKVTVAPSSVPYNGSVVITLSDPKWQGNTTLDAVRVGHSVVTVLSTSNAGSDVFAKSTAALIAAKVSAGGSE